MSVWFSVTAASLATSLPRVASATPATGEVLTSMVACSAWSASLLNDVAAAEKFCGITTMAA